MQIEVGSILDGKVTGITKFGAFVDLSDGKTGMVHISEVASTYVKDINDHLTENQMVKVKVLNISEDGKISLSIKKAMENQNQNQQRSNNRNSQSQRKPYQNRRNNDNRSFDRSNRRNENMSFEEMLAKFKQSSEEKMYVIKKNMDTKRGTSGKRNSNSMK